MATVLIAEPSAEVRELIAHVVGRLGHQAVEPNNGAVAVDAAIIEPAQEANVALALDLKRRTPGLPIICASTLPRGPEVRELELVAYLVKPFKLAALEHALESALSRHL